MASGDAFRSYEFVLNAEHAAPSGHVRRRGPDNALNVTRGRACADVIRLAGMIYPICPRAHMAAGIAAMEAAAGVTLPPGQSAAREAIVLAESVAGGLWRAALVWPQLLGETVVPERVRRVRQASEDLARAIFPGDWATIGGAPVEFDHAAAGDALNSLQNDCEFLAEVTPKIVQAANDASGPLEFPILPALGGGIWNPASAPGKPDCEESPRSLQQTGPGAACLGDWFQAQSDHTLALLGQLADRLQEIRTDAPADCPSGISGSGIGTSMTARGRLRHIVELEDSNIVRWVSTAPTDWNFSPTGPLATYSRALAPDRFESQSRWLIAALDPCAPCTVATSEVPADA